MSEPTAGTIELTCPGCQAYFRLKPKKGKFPKGPIPCPKCQTAIPLNIPKSDASGPGAAIIQPPQSGVLNRGKIRKGPSTNPAQPALPKAKDTEEDAFLRAADQLLDHTDKSPTSTFQGFGIAENLRRTSPRKEVEQSLPSEESPSGKNSTTDTSHFHREEDPTKAIDKAVIQKIQAAHQHETPVGGVNAMDTQTPSGGINPLDGDLTIADDEPGPFDMRDILDAERSKLESANPNEITHNPLLDGEPAVEQPDPVPVKKLPDDFPGSEPNFGATETIASDHTHGTEKTEASSEPPILHDEQAPLASRSDIFTDASASPPSEARQDDEQALPAPKPEEPDSQPKTKKPLAAMLRKKFGSQKLDDLRTSLNESSVSEPSQSDSSPEQSKPSLATGADEDDLAKILDEADSKRPSGEHQKLASRAAGPHQHPTKPAINVSEELSKRLANITPPSLNGDSEQEGKEDSIGARFRQRIQQDRSPDLEPGKPPAVKGSSLLAKLKPNRVPASDITGDIPIAPHLKQAQGLPDEASIPTEEAKSGSFGRFDLTPQRDEHTPSGISWATSDSIASSAAFQDHAQQVTRKRRRQESHSGLFPISGGIGQEDSVGFASERKGSGYIRLPTSEIIDVLGKGQYRLLVEDIVYEPVDERGLTELVKRGVILGAEKIAEPGGEWRPINEHPVFRRLKKKMAIEAHALLAKYRRPEADASSVMEEVSEDIPTPALKTPDPVHDEQATDNALAGQDFSNPTPSVIERLDDLSAELDEDSSPEGAASEPPSIPATALLHAVEPPPQKEEEELAPELDPISEALDEPAAEDQELDPTDEAFVQEEPARAEKETPAVQSLAEESSVVHGTQAFEDDPLEDSRRGPWLPILGVLVLGAIIVGGVLYTQPELRKQLFGGSTSPPSTQANNAQGPDTSNADDPVKNSGAKAVSTAMSTARGTVNKALALDLSDTTIQVELADTFAKDGDHALANTLYAMAWTPSSNQALAQRYADSLSAKKDYTALRQLAMSGLAGGQHRDFYETLRKQAIGNDASLKSLSFVQITKTSHGSQMELVNTGAGFVFKLTDVQGETWAFHPSQKRYEESQWHREVASWRLCQLIVCGIVIPEVTPATMSAEVFDHLMSAQGKGAAAPSERYGTLAWTSTGDAGKQVSGTLKRWVEPGAYWPFPYTNTWRPWLAAYEDAVLMKPPLNEALTNMQRTDKELYDALMAKNPNMTTEQLANQLSHAITFDFLTNNMNRFKERAAYNGERDNQLRDGKFYSLDHSTTMSSRLSSRVKGRFDWVQRFDRSTIESIRALDQEESSAILFPEGIKISRGEQQAFWKRRAKLLKEVDARAAKYGKENVLYFE